MKNYLKKIYDAIIIHSYANVIKGKSLDGQMITENLDSKDPDALFDILKLELSSITTNLS